MSNFVFPFNASLLCTGKCYRVYSLVLCLKTSSFYRPNLYALQVLTLVPFSFLTGQTSLIIFHGFNRSKESGPKQEMGRVVFLLRQWLICDMPASFLVSALLESWSSGLFCQTLSWKTVSKGYRCPICLSSKFLKLVV